MSVKFASKVVMMIMIIIIITKIINNNNNIGVLHWKFVFFHNFKMIRNGSPKYFNNTVKYLYTKSYNSDISDQMNLLFTRPLMHNYNSRL